MTDIYEDFDRLGTAVLLNEYRYVLRQLARYETEILDFVGFRYIQLQFAQEHSFKPGKLPIAFGAIYHSIERLRLAKLFKVLPFRILPLAIRGQQYDDMPSRLHDLIQCLLLSEPEEHTDSALFGSLPNFSERGF